MSLADITETYISDEYMDEYGSADFFDIDGPNDDEDIIYKIDDVLNSPKIFRRPILFEDTMDKNLLPSDDDAEGGSLWSMVTVGVIFAIITVGLVLYTAFQQRYRRLSSEMQEKRQATIATQRARMAQLRSEMESGKLLDAEALLYAEDTTTEANSSAFASEGEKRQSSPSYFGSFSDRRGDQ